MNTSMSYIDKRWREVASSLTSNSCSNVITKDEILLDLLIRENLVDLHISRKRRHIVLRLRGIIQFAKRSGGTFWSTKCCNHNIISVIVVPTNSTTNHTVSFKLQLTIGGTTLWCLRMNSSVSCINKGWNEMASGVISNSVWHFALRID